MTIIKISHPILTAASADLRSPCHMWIVSSRINRPALPSISFPNPSSHTIPFIVTLLHYNVLQKLRRQHCCTSQRLLFAAHAAECDEHPQCPHPPTYVRSTSGGERGQGM